MEKLGWIIFLVFFTNSALSQENAGTNVAPSLIECYNTSLITTRDLRLPSTMPVLIALIRKMEDGNRASNARTLATEILQRFRQDGIWKNEKLYDSKLGIPYSPKRWESFKGKIQLRKLTPGNSITFNNRSLELLERCSLHAMISSTIEVNERGDEATVCNQISRYTMRRVRKRQSEFAEKFGDPSSTRSECPLESGVVFTKWGEVKAGLVMSGLAAGFEQIAIPTKNGTTDNRYASTIAGELSEATLYQLGSEVKIGIKGGWNSTILPKYYFLQEKEKLHLTDAEIRGGLDGLYMALNIDQWKQKAGDIKLSQILDLYYSPRGVFNKTLKACNRNLLLTSLTTREKLIDETQKFTYLLNEDSTTNFSPNESAFYSLAQESVNSFYDYIPSLHDVECTQEDSVVERAAADVAIFVDLAWDYQDLARFIAYVLENIDVNTFESSYTVFNGKDGKIIVNKTRTILDFYEAYNQTTHKESTSGFDYNKVMTIMETLFRSKLDNSSDLTGQSTIGLLVPHVVPTSEQRSFAKDRKDEIIKQYLPDLKILIAGPGSKENYADFVTNPSSDVFILGDSSTEDTLKNTAKSLYERIKKIPRNVVNPACGSSFSSDEYASFDVTQYVEPTGVNYHRIAPNYFTNGNSENRNLKIRGQSSGTLSVCMSRTEPNPRSNSSTDSCKTISSDEVSYDVSSYCDDESVETCSPIYLSVEGLTSNIGCKDFSYCRFPDSIKYTITLENVGCDSSTGRLISSFTLISFTIFTVANFYI